MNEMTASDSSDAFAASRGGDDLFDRAVGPVQPFEFNAEVARVFPDMVRRSVPGYAELVGLAGLIARRVVPPGGLCYDLGCSLGAVSRAILRQCDAGVRVVAVDSSPAMIASLQQRLLAGAEVNGIDPSRLQALCADVLDVSFEPADLVVLNLTLQFVAPARRDELLQRVRAALRPGGALLLAEKIQAPAARHGALLTALHEDFKRANGYSELAIAGKRAALERVLEPDTIECHERRLREVGFSDSLRWFQNLNFVAWLAWT